MPFPVPQEVARLQALLAERDQIIARHAATITQHQATITQHQATITQHQATITCPFEQPRLQSLSGLADAGGHDSDPSFG